MTLIEKAYVRFREDLPDNQNTFASADGFAMQGIPVVPYYGFGDLKEFFDQGKLTKNTIVCGHIGDVWEVLGLLGRQIPGPLDYPTHLKRFLRRKTWETTLGEVRAGIDTVFVKPTKQKLFTGLVWDPSNPVTRLSIAIHPDDTPCLASELVDFVSEWRCFVRDGEIVGCKHYRGDWSISPDRLTVSEAVEVGRSEKMPAAHALDFGVTSSGETLLVEANEGYALGSYGLPSIVYARFLEARWVELVK